MTSTVRKALLPLLLLSAIVFFHRPYANLTKTLDEAIDVLADDIISKIVHNTGTFSSDPTFSPCEREWILYPGQEWPTLNPRKGCNIALGNPLLEICQYISGKRLLFVGPDTTYHLHSLWLNKLEAHEKRSHRCPGRDYCNFHHICRPPSSKNGEDPVEISRRKKKLPNRTILLAHNASLLQYALSTTLYASVDKEDTAYRYPTVDIQTGIRTSNTFWLRQARKADIIVMNRGPVPAPISTYPTGDWDFAQTLCTQINYLKSSFCGYNMEHVLANAAMHATILSFLPTLLHTLQAMTMDFEIAKSLILWHGTWSIQPLCAKMGLPKGVPLLRDIYPNNAGFVDSWSLYYNLQVYIHDRLLPRILSQYNITYVQLAIPGHPGHSYMRFVQEHAASNPLQIKDCIRHPWPKFAEDVLANVFFSDLLTLLARGI